MRRIGLSFSVKDVSVVIICAVCTVPSSLSRLKMAGYATKESAPRWLAHISTKLEADLGGLSPCVASGGGGGGGLREG